MPIHRPAAAGPAKVCPAPKFSGLIIPQNTAVAANHITTVSCGAKVAPTKVSPVHAMPPTRNNFRTALASWPFAIHRSDMIPLNPLPNACPTAMAAPTTAMRCNE